MAHTQRAQNVQHLEHKPSVPSQTMQWLRKCKTVTAIIIQGCKSIRIRMKTVNFQREKYSWTSATKYNNNMSHYHLVVESMLV